MSKKIIGFLKINKKIIFLFFATLLVYSFSGRGLGAHYNYFVLMADAFLHGRLYLTTHPSWLNELALWHGHYYTVYPPGPALLLIPFVAIFGTAFYQPALSIVLGAFNVIICYKFLSKFFTKENSFWTSVLYAFGTMQWYHASIGSVWYAAHIVAMFFIWLALLELVTKKRLFLVSFFIGFAYLATIPSALAAIFVLVFSKDDFIKFEKKKLKINFRNIFIFGAGFIPIVLFDAFYNYSRFGNFYDIGYSLLPVFNEPWYKYGLVSLRYIPIHLLEIFTAMPKFVPKPPFLIPSLFAMAVWFVTPAFLLLPFARFRTKLVFASLVAVLFMSFPSLVHGGNGFTQFGFRHVLDFLPFLLIMTASGMGDKIKPAGIILIVLSILVNLWGIVFINFLNIWTL